MFEDRMQRRISGHMRDEEKRCLRRLHDNELYNVLMKFS
jgi:hypothetical protein